MVEVDGYIYGSNYTSIRNGDWVCLDWETGELKYSQGWNGKGMYLSLQVPDAHSKMTQAYIYMKTADDTLVPWLASQTDMLSEDWGQV